MQSEVRPSAWRVELPSKPHHGNSSSLGKLLNSLICVLPRRFATGSYPSSQIYSSLYFAMVACVVVVCDLRAVILQRCYGPPPRDCFLEGTGRRLHLARVGLKHAGCHAQENSVSTGGCFETR